MSCRTEDQPQAVEINPNDVPDYLLRLANGPRSWNADDEQPMEPSMDSVKALQLQFNARDEAERKNSGVATLDQARNLRRHQNALFRPQGRVGNERQVARDSPIQRLVQLENPNLPMSEVMCALEKQEYVRGEVERRLAEAKAAGFKGNPTLERARALRTGTMMPRKTNLGQGNGAGSALLVGNNQVGPTGFRKSSASFDVSSNERNNFLRLATGVEFEGEKCQRMARKERGRIAPTPMAEPPPGFLPGGGRFLTEKERMDIAYDNPDRAGNFAKPFKPINVHQWTDRPVSYKPPTRHFLEDEIPVNDPPTAGAFMQPEPIGDRIYADDQMPYNGIPGDNYAAVEAQQIRAPRDESRMAKFKKDIGPLQPRFPYTASYDDQPIEQSEKMPVYAIVKPKIERKNLERTTVDSITRGIQMVDEAALYDPSVYTPMGIKSNQVEQDKKSQLAEQTSMEAAKQQFQAARLIGDNTQSAAVVASMQKDLTGEKAIAKGLQREQTSGKAVEEASHLNSKLAIGGDPDMFHDGAQASAVQRAMQAPEDPNSYLRARMREVKSQAGMLGDQANVMDERFIDGTKATVGTADRSVEQKQRATMREKLSLLKARLASQRANAFDDEQMFADTSASRVAAESLNSYSAGGMKRVEKDRERAQRNFERVNDAMQRVRLTITDGDDPTQDYGSAADRVARQMQVQTKSDMLSAKTRQLEQRMMDNANNRTIELNESLIDTSRPGQGSTQVHRESGAEGARVRAKEVAALQNAQQNASRASMLDDNGEQFGAAADRVAQNMTLSTLNMSDSAVAQHTQAKENKTLDQARFQAGRASAFDDLDPQSVGRVSSMMSTSLEDKARLAQKENAIQAQPMRSQLDINTVGDNAISRMAADGMRAPQSTEAIQRGQVKALNSMRAAAESMQAQNFGSGLDLQNFNMNTSANVKEIDLNRQALADQRIMNKIENRWTALDETHSATGYQEGLISGNTGGERAERGRIKGLERERAMYATDQAARQTLRPTDTGMFEHFTVDNAIGTEPRGGQAAFDNRNARREEKVQNVQPPTYDAVSDYLTVEHVLQRLDATRCDRPSAVLAAQRQKAYQEDMARKERGVPTHLLPKEMFAGHRKQFTPRGSPIPSPIPR